MAPCKIKSFRAMWSNWDISWPSGWGNNSTIRLPVTFRLELDDSCSKSDCIVGQLKRGKAAIGGYAGSDVWPTWTGDGEIGRPYWWDGERLSNAGMGDWSWGGNVATFKDKPGFYKVPGGSSLYFGDVGGSGYFDFQTFVKDRATGAVVKAINWSMRIDVPTPGSGGKWWSFSDQK
jgi:hypothetical protein